jgi:mono/diheme cytochrome c family protein
MLVKANGNNRRSPRASGSSPVGKHLAGLAGLLASTIVMTVQAQDSDQAGEVTWARDVAPLLQENCQECHRPDSIAPMSLLTYEQARAFAPIIRQRVENRVMPPWHVNPYVGIQQFANDRGLTAEERQTIINWVDQGTPRGDPADAPASRDFSRSSGWRLEAQMGAEPDLVIESEPFDLAAQTQDKWFRPRTPTGLEEARWVKAIEIRPANDASRRVIHHTLAFLDQDEEEVIGLPDGVTPPGGAGLFMEWAVGKAGQVFLPDTGKLMLPDSEILWEVHLHAMGERVPDARAEMAVWFHEQPPQRRTILTMFDARGEQSLDIPPNSMAVTQGETVLQAPARLENFQPHMHMRGTAMSMEAIYPDGSREVLSFVDNFQWNWQINYIYEQDYAPVVPAGTTIVTTAWHDNTANHASNPDPDQWVGWGDRTVDEMAHNWVDVTYLDEETYERLREEREQRDTMLSVSNAR